jgi:hypothetical protein
MCEWKEIKEAIKRVASIGFDDIAESQVMYTLGNNIEGVTRKTITTLESFLFINLRNFLIALVRCQNV